MPEKHESPEDLGPGVLLRTMRFSVYVACLFVATSGVHVHGRRRRRLCGVPLPPPTDASATGASSEPAAVADPSCHHHPVVLRNGSTVQPYCSAFNQDAFLENGEMATTIVPICYSETQRLDERANYCLSSAVFTAVSDRFVDVVSSSCPDHTWGDALAGAATKGQGCCAAAGGCQIGKSGSCAAAAKSGCCAAVATAGSAGGCQSTANTGCCAAAAKSGCCAAAAGSAGGCQAAASTGCCAAAAAAVPKGGCCAVTAATAKAGCCASSAACSGSAGCQSKTCCSSSSPSCSGGCGGLPLYTPARHTVHLRIPVLPRVAAAPSSLASSLGNPDAPVAILANGVLVYNHTMTPSFDGCLGHIDANHHYHYHAVPACLLSRMGVTTPPLAAHSAALLNLSSSSSSSSTLSLSSADSAKHVLDVWPKTGKPSPVVGWALDGFPIFGPYDDNGDLQVAQGPGVAAGDAAMMTGSMVANATLDACNGKRMSDGQYAYFMAPNARYMVGCFSGTPGQARDAGPLPATGSSEQRQPNIACTRSPAASIYFPCPKGSLCDPAVAAGWSASMYCGTFIGGGDGSKAAADYEDTSMSMAGKRGNGLALAALAIMVGPVCREDYCSGNSSSGKASFILTCVPSPGPFPQPFGSRIHRPLDNRYPADHLHAVTTASTDEALPRYSKASAAGLPRVDDGERAQALQQ